MRPCSTTICSSPALRVSSNPTRTARLSGGVEGDVWIGTVDRGVWHWRGGGVDRFDESGGLPDPRVLSIAIDGNRAYVGTPVGVAEFENGRYARTLGTGLFASAIAVRHDTLFIGTLDETIAEISLAARPSRGVRPLVNNPPGAIHRFLEPAVASSPSPQHP